MAIRTIINLVPPKIRGAIMVGLVKSMSSALKVSWNSGLKYAASAGLNGFKSGLKVLSNVKYAKALNIIGVADLVGGALVKSSVDSQYYGLIPGSGLLELGAAVINQAFGTSLLNATWGLSI